MCSFDNKRFLLDDNISSLAYGHYSITNKINVDEVENPTESLTLTHAQVVEKRLPGFAYTGQLRKPVRVSEKVEVLAVIPIPEVVKTPLPLPITIVNATLPLPLVDETLIHTPTRNDAHELWTDESSIGSDDDESIFDSDEEADEVEVRFDESEIEETIGVRSEKSCRKRVSNEEIADAPVRKLKNN